MEALCMLPSAAWGSFLQFRTAWLTLISSTTVFFHAHLSSSSWKFLKGRSQNVEKNVWAVRVKAVQSFCFSLFKFGRFKAHRYLQFGLMKVFLGFFATPFFLRSTGSFSVYINQPIKFSYLGINLCKLCSQFNLQVSCFIFCPLKPMTPAPLAGHTKWLGLGGKLNYRHWFCSDCDSCPLWTSKLGLIGLGKALTLVKKTSANFDSTAKRKPSTIRTRWKMGELCLFLLPTLCFYTIPRFPFKQTVTSCWVTPRATAATPSSTALMASVSWRASPEPRWCRRTAAATSCSGPTPVNMWPSRCWRLWSVARSTRPMSTSTRKTVSVKRQRRDGQFVRSLALSHMLVVISMTFNNRISNTNSPDLSRFAIKMFLTHYQAWNIDITV